MCLSGSEVVSQLREITHQCSGMERVADLGEASKTHSRSIIGRRRHAYLLCHHYSDWSYIPVLPRLDFPDKLSDSGW
jgi:hypothetical protein